jgi:hypothetical protein
MNNRDPFYIGLGLLWLLGTCVVLFFPTLFIFGLPIHKVDGVGHVLIFFLGYLFLNLIFSKKITLLLLITLAILSEVFQFFGGIRHMTIEDLTMNLVGICLGILVSLCLNRNRHRELGIDKK